MSLPSGWTTDPVRCIACQQTLLELKGDRRALVALLLRRGRSIPSIRKRVRLPQDEVAAIRDRLVENGEMPAPPQRPQRKPALPPPDVVAARRARIEAELRGDPSASNAEIAERASVSPNTVRRRRLALGMPPPPSRRGRPKPRNAEPATPPPRSRKRKSPAPRKPSPHAEARARVDAALRETPQKPTAALAVEVGVSTQIVQRRRRALGIPSPPNRRGQGKRVNTYDTPLGRIVKEELTRDPARTDVEIARDAGTQARTVRKWRRRLGLAGASPP